MRLPATMSGLRRNGPLAASDRRGFWKIHARHAR